jgi:hypothetical protein
MQTTTPQARWSPSLGMFLRISSALGVTPQELLDETRALGPKTAPGSQRRRLSLPTELVEMAFVDMRMPPGWDGRRVQRCPTGPVLLMAGLGSRTCAGICRNARPVNPRERSARTAVGSQFTFVE